MEESIIQYLLTMGVIAAPTKANKTAPVVPQPPEHFLEKCSRFLSLSRILTSTGLTLVGISMLPKAAKLLVLQGLLFFAAGVINIFDILAVWLSTLLTWIIDIDSMLATYWW